MKDTNHKHRWMFLGELLRTYTKEELKYTNPKISRLEYCGGCSTARLHISGDTWAIIQGDVTREYLQQFKSETNEVVNKPPRSSTFKTVTKKPKRLGKGLSELTQESARSNKSLPELFLVK